MIDQKQAPATQLALQSGPPRILVADPIAEDGVARLRAAGHVDVATGLPKEELIARIGEYDALVVRSETKVTADVFAAATRLRVVGRAGVGVDNIDLDAATRHGVLVLNAPTGNTLAAAEHAITMMCALARNVAAADASMHSGKWERGKFMGFELREKTLGLLGLGKIGFEVARIAGQGLQMRVIAHDPLVTPERAEQAGVELVDLDALVRESDVLSVHVPLTDQTRGVINAQRLRQMKPGARLLNVARGGIIDEQALADALHDGHIAGAAVDVFTKEPPPPENPLLSAPNMVLTPHLGASTVEAQVNVAFDVADQIATVLSGGAARYAVNAPMILPEEMAELAPYLDLAGKMGQLAAQLGPESLRRVVCTYTGELADRETIVLTAEALRGLFAPFTETRINAINAKTVARTHGVEIEERKSTRSLDYSTAMSLEVIGTQPLSITGTLLGGEPRITRIDDLRVDMRPEGIYLVDTHHDRPGVIASVASLLAKNDINIAGLDLGRNEKRGRAVMLMQIDEPAPDALLEEIRTSAGLDTLRQVRL
ncbi:MAG TPA: phosphoglycerate dehydrogenase [Candidatus Dormibacteraeota bacterium]|nr:phosphoglycerate dehydrogenase [Candidatus Dormibacteraeota bacterium]